MGASVGAHLAFGTHFQRLGFNFNFFIIEQHVQLNSELKLYYNFKNLGPRTMYPELVLSQGILFGWQHTNDLPSIFMNVVSNQTPYQYAVAYAYNAYFNKRKTTQQTGIVALYFDKLAIISENDLLAKPALDRFRTAAFLVQYQLKEDIQLGINCTLWTGKYGYKKQIDNPKFKRACYLDTLGGIYSNQSHGLLSLQAKMFPINFQAIQANVGVDAEQVRNVVQNKFIHDMPFLPKKWNKSNNCHIPMLDENGNPFLYLENQKIRKPKAYLNVFSNGSLFY